MLSSLGDDSLGNLVLFGCCAADRIICPLSSPLRPHIRGQAPPHADFNRNLIISFVTDHQRTNRRALLTCLV